MTTLQEQDQKAASEYAYGAEESCVSKHEVAKKCFLTGLEYERKRQSERVWKLTNAFAVYAKHQGICSILEGVDCRCGLDDFMKQFESEGIKND